MLRQTAKVTNHAVKVQFLLTRPPVSPGAGDLPGALRTLGPLHG